MRGDADHLVASEVTAELHEAGDGLASTALAAGSELQTVVVRWKTLAAKFEDSDGDLDLPRPKKRRAAEVLALAASTREDGSVASEKEEHCLRLVVRLRTSWRAAGSQIWRAALLLAEFIEARPDLFVDATVLEFGCGVGLVSIIVARVARCVFATDGDIGALRIAQRNIEDNCTARNASEDHKCNQSWIAPTKCVPATRIYDWKTENLPWQEGVIRKDEFSWKPSDTLALGQLGVVIASDVFYDEETSRSFLQALRHVMLSCDRPLVVILTLEQRQVFSAETMSVVSLGFDTLRAHLCSHKPETSHSRAGVNRVRCRECARIVGTANPRFVAHKYPVDEIPHTLQYDKPSTLMIWVVDAVVILYCEANE